MALAEHSKLVSYLNDLLGVWREQRKQLLEAKWSRNLSAFKRECSEADMPWSKPPNFKPWQSTTVSDLTKSKVVAGKVAVCDIMLRGGKVQYLLQREEDDATGLPMQNIPAGGPDAGAGGQPGGAEVGATAGTEMPGAAINPTEMIERHKALIDRQLEWCDAEGELGAGVLYGALTGETWVHTFIRNHEERRVAEILPGTGIFDRVTEVTPAPAVEHVSPWEMFWDMEWGPRKGDGLCRIQYMSPSDLRDLKHLPLYIPEAINDVLADKKEMLPSQSVGGGGDDSQDPVKRRRNANKRRNIAVMEFQCRVPQSVALQNEKDLREKYPKAEFDFADDLVPTADLEDGETDEDYTVEINCVVACDTVIRYSRVESASERSYFRCIWEDDPEGFGGISVADNVEMETGVLTKLTRALEDICKISSRIILAGKRRLIDGDARIDMTDPDTFIELSESVTDVREALQQFQVSAPIGEILRALEYFLAIGDMSSNIPRAQQGQEAGNPQTFSELRERLNRAGMYMGDVFRHYDELIEDVIEWFVEQNLTDPELDFPKMPIRVRALGFASYMDRVVKLDAIYGLLDRILNNQTLQQICNVKPLVQEAAKASDIEPTLFLKTNEELQEAAAREEQLLAAQQGEQRPSSGAEVQAQMAKVQALLAAVEKTKAETERINEEITAKRAETTKKLMDSGSPPPPPVAGLPGAGAEGGAPITPQGLVPPGQVEIPPMGIEPGAVPGEGEQFIQEEPT